MNVVTPARGSLGNLPAEVTSFVGRRHEVAGVRRLLSTARLVTLTGPGGVGKTRLAYRVGTELRRAYPDGVWLVELAELTDPALLTVTIAEALGIDSSAAQGAASLTGFLADRQALLILDNCEQLVGAIARLTETLLRACPDLRILATSRQALRTAGEATFTVAPLSVPERHTVYTPAALSRYESTGLLVDRAAAVLPDFEVTDANAGTIAALCRALEGMPLAIELAAVRLRVLSLEQILARLTDRYHLLTSGPRSAPARQQTLRALIDWSWDLCSEAERTLWARLSVFAGGLELDAAEEVCTGGELSRETILDLIASLVDKSVLVTSGDGTRVRYRLLEVIREYGAARLREAGEQAALRRRHCQWYASLAARGDAHWVSKNQADLMRRLRHEQSNLRVALEFAVVEGPPETALRFAADLENFWYVRGHLAEGRHWLERALAMGEPRHWTRVKALRVAAWLNTVLGDSGLGERQLDDAQALADTLPRSVENWYIPIVRGNIRMFAGDNDAALPLFEEALAGFREMGARSGEMWSLAVLGIARGLSGDPLAGYADLRACIALAEDTGEVWWRSFALWALGVLQWRAGELPQATASLRQSLMVRERVEDEQFSVGLTMETLAWIAGDEHRDERAALLLGASERMWRAMRTSLSVFRSLQDFHTGCTQRVSARMGETAFEAAIRRGAELSAAGAFDLALERDPEIRPAPGARAPDPLTRREREVAMLLAEGLSNREIATRLVVAQRTAEGHVENILSKLGLTSRAQVAAWMAGQSAGPS